MADRGKRRRAADRPADEIFLTRRIFIFKGLVGVGFAALVGKLGQMQMVDARRYEDQAEVNSTRTETLKAPRGLIVDRDGQILAENRTAWTVSIVPSQVPRDESVRGYVRDQLTEALGLRDVLVARKSALPRQDEQVVLESLAAELGEDPGALTRRVRSFRGDYVAIREQLSPEDAARFEPLGQRLPGVQVMNRIDYLLGLYAGIPTPVEIAQDVPRDVALSLEANAVFLPGVVVDDSTLVRRYTGGPLFSHILGYVGPITREEYEAAEASLAVNPYLPTDWVGRGGIEEAMQDELRGEHGVRWYNADARGVEISELVDRRREPRPGLTVQLTIDREFQQAVADALREGIERAHADALAEGREPVGSGVAVAIDPRNGEVLAMVSLPSFDNQLFVDGISQEQFDAYLNDPYFPLTNMAVSGTFPPGSTIKPHYACAALQEGKITTQTTYRCAGEIRVPTVDEAGENWYVCWLRSPGHGPIAVHEAVAESCDIFFYNVGAPNQTPPGADRPLHYYIPGDPNYHVFEGLGIELMERYLRDAFGFGKTTGIELAHEAAGVVPNPTWLFQSPLREHWSVGDTINVSIGQGHFTCTPLQLACSVVPFANGGTYYRPRLVKALLNGRGEVVREIAADPLWQLPVNREYIEVARESMLLTVTDGTAKGKFPKTGSDIPIAGKTGTAEFGEGKFIEGGRTKTYSKQHAWFIAFAPYDEPRIALAVLVIGGGGGSTYAAPVADGILAAFFGR